MEELPAWSDDYWREKSDGPWRRGLRLQQGWWRSAHTGFGPGLRSGRDKPVVSMLPEGVGMGPNVMTEEARHAAEFAIDRMKNSSQPGIIEQDRLKRNLLSSQPMCFNIFGHLRSYPEALLPWVQELAPAALTVTRIELEWAPLPAARGGSAFDAYVEYQRTDGRAGFLGIECKYAEKLTESQRGDATEKYRSATTPPAWAEGAVELLDRHGLRQLWYNQLHTQDVSSQPGFAEGLGVVVACAADRDAHDAVEKVRATLTNPDELRFSSLEAVVAAVNGQEGWKKDFVTRYLDFTPIADLLSDDDPRRPTA